MPYNPPRKFTEEIMNRVRLSQPRCCWLIPRQTLPRQQSAMPHRRMSSTWCRSLIRQGTQLMGNGRCRTASWYRNSVDAHDW